MASTGAVTMQTNTIGIGCGAGNGGEGSNDFSGGFTIPEGGGTPTLLPFAHVDVAAVPVPAAAWLFGSGLLGLIGIARRKKV